MAWSSIVTMEICWPVPVMYPCGLRAVQIALAITKNISITLILMSRRASLTRSMWMSQRPRLWLAVLLQENAPLLLGIKPIQFSKSILFTMLAILLPWMALSPCSLSMAMWLISTISNSLCHNLLPPLIILNIRVRILPLVASSCPLPMASWLTMWIWRLARM